jgi:hypothetical protein
MVHTFDEAQSGLRALSVSFDSLMLFSGGEERAIRLWSIGSAGFALRHTLTDAHGGWVWILLTEPTKQFLFSGSGED